MNKNNGERINGLYERQCNSTVGAPIPPSGKAVVALHEAEAYGSPLVHAATVVGCRENSGAGC